MTITEIRTPGAPAAIGPYSQAIACGGLLFCSGQIGLDPASGRLVDGGAAAQAARAMANLEAVLRAAGTDWQRVVKTTIYLLSMDDFAIVNEVYARSFPATKPARATIAAAALPKGARVEIDCIATLA